MSGTWKSLAVIGALVIGMYIYTAPLGRLESLISNPADTPYNLLVQGFRDGHLSLKKEAPPGFSHLTDPYDPDANWLYRGMPYGLSDLSYYKGRLYLYFGVTPALLLFWPFVALTGHYLFDRMAVIIFCAIGITAALGLLRAVWRRYFAGVSVGVVAACALALVFATGIPMLLPRSDFYQVAVSCGYMLTMLALGAVWCALHDTEKRCWWLLAASVTYGLAVGARPSLLFGGIILLVPVVHAWGERRSIWPALLAATIPITFIGLGLMLYNTLRFDSPFEFGQRYQLGAVQQVTLQFFNLHYLGFNLLVNFLEPARWNAHFPFVYQAAAPPLPPGYFGVQDPFGVLTNIPLVWLALAAPLAWRERSDPERSALRRFVTAVGLLFGMCALTLAVYCSAAGRYEVDFLPALVLLAVIGILGLERALANRPHWRRRVRWGWCALLVFSVVFNLLVSAKNYAAAGCSLGTMLTVKGRVPEAIGVFDSALRIDPNDAEGHNNLGLALSQAGRGSEAIHEYEDALRLKPDYVAAHVALGVALVAMGKADDAIRHYEEALRLKPHSAEAQIDFGNALLTEGKGTEAMPHYEEALRINPDYPQAHVDLGIALAQAGKIPEAMKHWEAALSLRPDDAVTHYNLGNALEAQGRVPEAIEHYRQALRFRPNFTVASNALARLQAAPATR